MNDSYYERDGNRYRPTDLTIGPWSPDAQHAGPPSALLAGSLEAAAPSHMQLVRLTVELYGPIPMTPLEVETIVTRPGGRITMTEASLSADGRPCARALGVHHRVGDVSVPAGRPSGSIQLPGPSPSPLPSPVPGTAQTWFGQSLEARYEPPHSGPGAGPRVVWLRTNADIVAGEPTSPFQWVVPLADCGNGISWLSQTDVIFPNSDLTVYLHRVPVDRWVRLDATSTWQSTGTGLAESDLSDRRGPIGRSAQSLFLESL
ncbi:MAG: thioesterase family protein [Acidimicrobiia bacterium]|nr:thioesterase family protein [Acidimicrobiia bacterium]